MAAFSDPIFLKPIYCERVWGGRKLESVYGRTLPDGDTPYGESWEVVDREDEQSVVAAGQWAGTTLHTLWTEYRESVFGTRAPQSERFPILCKILDAKEKLSIQVHPPQAVADQLRGEPKTEMWYIAQADADADLYVGMRQGVSRARFAKGLEAGGVAELVHRLESAPGKYIFIPSGRLHAIGAGNLIFEIQQNSDTTYRVFDWNRVGLDGKLRQLHIEESLQCIDFDDVEPDFNTPQGGLLVACEYFQVSRYQLVKGAAHCVEKDFAILACVAGSVAIAEDILKAGDFCLLPAELAEKEVVSLGGTSEILVTSFA